MKKLLLFYFLIGLLGVSCKSNKENLAMVKGTITHANGEMIFLQKINKNNLTAIDSTLIAEDGTFELEGEAIVPGYYSLALSQKNSLTLIIHPGEIVTVTAEKSDLRNTYDVEGSADSKLLKELDTKFNYYYSKLVELNEQYNDFVYSEDHSDIGRLREQLDSTFEVLRNEYRVYIMGFIDKNMVSLASFSALYQAISQQEYLLDPYDDYAYYKKVDSSLTVNYPQSDVTRFMNESMMQINEQRKYMEQKAKQLALGMIAPEISLPTPQGDTLTLSSLKGKYVLLDFWASWCAPCRIENPNLVKNYRKFVRKGFTIFQVSLDREKQSWLNAIQDDQLGAWHHVSDLQFWNSVVVPVYNIQGIPANFLLNKEGRIIAKDLRGEELERTLIELLNK